MKVSNCCGDPGTKIYSYGKSEDDVITYSDVELCGYCKEHCEYVEENDTETKEENITKVWDSLK